MKRKGRIVDVYPLKFTSCTLTQGVKNENQRIYDNDERYHGGNGTYSSNYSSQNSLIAKVVLYETDLEPQETVEIDFRESVLQSKPEWKNISAQRLEKIKIALKGQKMFFEKYGDDYEFDIENLKLIES